MTRPRDERLRLWLAHRAAAAALEASLKDEAAALFDKQGSADTWRLSAGQVIVQLTQDRAIVLDREALLGWLAVTHPHQVRVTTVQVVTPINEKWLAEELLPGLTPLDPDELPSGGQTQMMDDAGTLVPGVVWQRGGGLHGVAIRPDAGMQRRLRAAAAAYVEGAGQMSGIETGERRGSGDDSSRRSP